MKTPTLVYISGRGSIIVSQEHETIIDYQLTYFECLRWIQKLAEAAVEMEHGFSDSRTAGRGRNIQVEDLQEGNTGVADGPL